MNCSIPNCTRKSFVGTSVCDVHMFYIAYMEYPRNGEICSCENCDKKCMTDLCICSSHSFEIFSKFLEHESSMYIDDIIEHIKSKKCDGEETEEIMGSKREYHKIGESEKMDIPSKRARVEETSNPVKIDSPKKDLIPAPIIAKKDIPEYSTLEQCGSDVLEWEDKKECPLCGYYGLLFGGRMCKRCFITSSVPYGQKNNTPICARCKRNPCYPNNIICAMCHQYSGKVSEITSICVCGNACYKNKVVCIYCASNLSISKNYFRKLKK